MKDTDILELKKDVNVPGRYLRAGTRHTKEDWHSKFPQLSERWDNEWDEWFINLSIVKPEPPPDLKGKIISEVFGRLGLYSVSYKVAASQCMDEYLKQNYSQQK